MKDVKVSRGNKIVFDEKTDIFFCDPCYLFDHNVPELDKAWQDFCNSTTDDSFARNGILEFKGAKILYGSTCYGDGGYGFKTDLKVANGVTICGVDAGLLCVVSFEDACKINPAFSRTELGALLKDHIGEICYLKGNWEGDCGFSCLTDDLGDEFQEDEEYDG